MRLITTILASTLLSGCGLWPIEDASNNLTVGAVQQSVYIGMSGAEVAMALGSPNIVSTDEFRNEVWIYDRFSTERVQTEGPDAISLLQSLVDSGGALDGTSTRQSESSSQKTLTVIIKFDEDGLVRDYAYHTSRF